MRLIKILLSLGIALLCLFYATQNLANIQAAHGAVGYVVGNLEHESYPNSFGPAFSHPAFIWAALSLIILLEYLAGLLALKGSWDLWVSRNKAAAEFHTAKHFVYLGSGVALIVWFFLFQVIGGAFFQQWQTQAGWLSLEGAFTFSTSIALLALFIAQVPDD